MLFRLGHQGRALEEMPWKLKPSVIKRSGHVAIWMEIKIFQREGTDNKKAWPYDGNKIGMFRPHEPCFCLGPTPNSLEYTFPPNNVIVSLEPWALSCFSLWSARS